MKFRLLLFCIVLACGCATDRYDFSLRGVKYHDDARPMLSELVEAVTPEAMPDTGLKALILPFAVRQDVGVRREVGRELGDVFQRAWLEKRVFEVMEFESSLPWPGLTEALALARARGANFLVTGNVTQFFEGSGTGRTSIALTIEIHWVPTSTLIWSAAQAAVMEAGLDKDYVVVRTTRRLPEQPTYAVMRALSESLAEGFARHFPR